ncbi:hypothetical protein [Streptomyces sp. NPDC029674]|uniref:hypothetical protein n=1 Tax=Streptomyces sp. NPDC029674 TaxID=3365297 RepID=UPI00384EBFFB
MNTTRQLGGAVGLALLGTLATAFTGAAGGPAALAHGYRAAFLLAAAIAATAAALTPLLSRRATPTTSGAPTRPSNGNAPEGVHR